MVYQTFGKQIQIECTTHIINICQNPYTSFMTEPISQYSVQVRSIENITHDVIRIITDKPDGYAFQPGQATEIAINKNGWKNKKRLFTFTSLPFNDFLEFSIKTYPDHMGVTNELILLRAGDQLLIGKAVGAIHYKGEGVFIAGGAGVTPFISIFRWLNATHQLGNNQLIFSNKTYADIILKDEFTLMLGEKFVNILSAQSKAGIAQGMITSDFLRKTMPVYSTLCYICGPPPMMTAIEKDLSELGIQTSDIIKESF